MAKMIHSETTVQRNDAALMTNELGDELVIMDNESGNYIGLNPIGYVIWKQLDSPAKVKDLVKNLTNRYNIKQEECEIDTIAYLEKMASLNLIHLS
jgi:hypothetical protein